MRRGVKPSEAAPAAAAKCDKLHKPGRKPKRGWSGWIRNLLVSAIVFGVLFFYGGAGFEQLMSLVGPHISDTVAGRQNHNNSTHHYNIYNKHFQIYNKPGTAGYNIRGAEAFAQTSDGRIFTTTYDGRIVQIIEETPLRYKTVARTGTNVNCATPEKVGEFPEPRNCSRPLGVVVSPKNENILFIADAWKGLLEVDVTHTCDFVASSTSLSQHEVEKERKRKTEQERPIFTKDYTMSSNVKILADKDAHGNALVLPDGIATDPEGNAIYFTGLTSRHFLDLFIFEFFEPRMRGRLYRYDVATKSVEVVLDHLVLPNGLVRSFDDQSILMVANGDEVMKYFIAGPKKGKTTPFATGLGVMCDNITRHPTRKTYFVSGATDRTLIIDQLLKHKWLRDFFRAIVPYSLHHALLGLIKGRWTTLELDQDGKYISSFGRGLGDTDIYAVSEYFETKKGLGLVGAYAPTTHLVALKMTPRPEPKYAKPVHEL